MTATEPIYVDLASESEDPGVTQIDSYCFGCNGKGVTRLLITKIPHYKEVIISSFECNECGEKNNSIQTNAVQALGVKFELRVEKIEDLSRQIVKSDHSTVKIPDLDFEIPADGKRGEITTVEGIIRKAIDGLSQDQTERKGTSMELFQKIQNFINKLESLLELENSFILLVDDPSGNSFVENLFAPEVDEQLNCTTFKRTKAQNQFLGFDHDAEESSESTNLETITENESESELNLSGEVLQFNTICDQCSRPSVTKMKVTLIPHFKEVVIMATECSSCGYRTNEVKSGGGIEEKGKKFSLHVQAKVDMARDVLKSETCSITVPELDLYVGAGIFVGKFTTVEGILTDIKEDLFKNPFLLGDAAVDDRKIKIHKLVKDIQEVIDGTSQVHLVLDDPAGNSFLQDIYTPEKDPFLVVETYERSFEQNEDMGLNDMITENYGENN